MKHLERAKEDILKVFAKSRAKAGDPFDAKAYFYNAATIFNPREKDPLEDALKELVAEGLVEEKRGQHVLTQKGFEHINRG